MHLYRLIFLLQVFARRLSLWFKLLKAHHVVARAAVAGATGRLVEEFYRVGST